MSGRIMGHLYLFSPAPLRPIVVVAAAGGVGDWAAYIGGVETWGEPTDVHLGEIRNLGFKLTEAQARAFFPYIEGPYRE